MSHFITGRIQNVGAKYRHWDSFLNEQRRTYDILLSELSMHQKYIQYNFICLILILFVHQLVQCAIKYQRRVCCSIFWVGVLACDESVSEARQCHLKPCTLNSCAETDWTPWGECQVTCGPGSMTRSRQLANTYAFSNLYHNCWLIFGKL